MSKQVQIWVATTLLCLSFGLHVTSARLKSATYDEQFYIVRGAAYVKLRDQHILVGEPLLLNALSALPLLVLPDLRLPVDSPSWSSTSFHAVSSDFIWHVNDNADQILFLSRLPTMYLGLLLAVFVYRWARGLFGPWGGTLALFLCVLDPNLIAHGRLAATDLGSTALMAIAAYWTWRLFCRPTWRGVLLAGAFLGLALSSRFSALALGPSFAVLYLWRAFVGKGFAIYVLGMDRYFERSPRWRWWERLIWLAVVAFLILAVAYLVIWAVHGFQIGPIEGWTSFPVLAPTYFEQFQHILGRLLGQEGREVVGFLMGELYVGGRPAYFPVAFLLKTPLPTLVLAACAAIVAAKRHRGDWLPVVWLPPLVFMGISLTSKINLGYRYILPVVPFVLVLAGYVGRWASDVVSRMSGRRRAFVLVPCLALVAWSAWSGLSIYPHYLAYFNELAGGPENGWRFLVDSNVDWGQDLVGLKRWMDLNGVERIKLAYTGEAYPSYYGIDFDPLPSSPDRWEHPLHHELYHADPAPGVYAISANLLQGRTLADPDTYAWFRERDPLDVVGYSIYIYRVPSRGEGQVTLGLSGLVPADIRPGDYALLGTNDVHVLWFDEQRAIVYPRQGDRAVFMVAEPLAVHEALSVLWPWQENRILQLRDGRPAHVYDGTPRDQFEARSVALARDAPVWHLAATQFVPGDPGSHGEQLDYPVQFGELVELVAYETAPGSSSSQELEPGQALTLVTYWQIRDENDDPVKLFVHLLDGEGTYVAGEDRLDVWYENWRTGDAFVQVQEVTLGPDAAPGEYQLELGWYAPQTMQRLPVIRDGAQIADRVLLQPVRVR